LVGREVLSSTGFKQTGMLGLIRELELEDKVGFPSIYRDANIKINGIRLTRFSKMALFPGLGWGIKQSFRVCRIIFYGSQQLARTPKRSQPMSGF